MVTGSDNPPTLNTELFVLAALTVTLAPLAVKLPEAVPLVPTTTLPNPRVAGATLSWPLAVVPVPDIAIDKVGFDAVDVIVILPLTAPDDVGANVALKLALWPAPSVTGTVIPP